MHGACYSSTSLGLLDTGSVKSVNSSASSKLWQLWLARIQHFVCFLLLPRSPGRPRKRIVQEGCKTLQTCKNCTEVRRCGHQARGTPRQAERQEVRPAQMRKHSIFTKTHPDRFPQPCWTAAPLNAPRGHDGYKRPARRSSALRTARQKDCALVSHLSVFGVCHMNIAGKKNGAD